MMAADIADYLRGLEKHDVDNVWRIAKQARKEIERLRAIIAERDARTCENCKHKDDCMIRAEYDLEACSLCEVSK